jgi:hypothetical protein
MRSPDDIVREYRRRLDERRRTLAERDRACFRVSQLRLAIVGAAVLILVVGGLGAANWLLVPLAVFVPVAFWHGWLLNRRDRARSAVDYYERALARVAGDWAGRGRTGDRFRPADHPYAADLDIFGRGSVFEFLAASRTPDGDATLAHWLLSQARADEIRERQAAVRELIPRLDLRESAAVLGDVVGEQVNQSRLRRWAAEPIRLRGSGTRLAIAGLVACSTIGWIWWWTTDTFAWGAGILLTIQSVVALVFKERVEAVSEGVEATASDLDLIGGLLRALEAETFTSPLLQRLQGAVADGGRAPSREIARLSRRAALLASHENLAFAIPAAFVMWTTQWSFAMDAWREASGVKVGRWLDAVGEFEALLSLATLAFERPAYSFPEIVDGPPLLAAKDLAHPLLPSGAVANDLSLGDDGVRLVIVSGSNMSGKSTWLRTIGVNVVLAQAGAPVRAAAFRWSPVDLGAAISIQDSLGDGRSRFFAEIRRIAQVVALSKSRGGRVLFLFDELLGGTNSHDRRAGAEALLGGLLAQGAIGLATTHDLALGEIADRLAPQALNVHFEDQFDGDTPHFDYRLRPGVVQTSNALALMRSVGLDV